MATKDKKGGAGAGTKGGGKGGDRREKKTRGPHAGANLPVPPARLHGFYSQTVRPKLMQQFSLTNPHQVPTLQKIVLNVGAGEAIKQPKFLDTIVDELAII